MRELIGLRKIGNRDSFDSAIFKATHGWQTLSVFALGLAFTGAVQKAPYAVIFGTGLPLVTYAVNSRANTSSKELRIRIEPPASAKTLVRWTSTDGKNDFLPAGITTVRPSSSYTATIDNAIGIRPHGFARGAAIKTGVGPGNGCSGANIDPNATSYRIVFRNGGRVRNDALPN